MNPGAVDVFKLNVTAEVAVETDKTVIENILMSFFIFSPFDFKLIHVFIYLVIVQSIYHYNLINESEAYLVYVSKMS